LVVLLGIVTLSALLVVALRWLDPPFSSFMAQDWIGGLVERRDRPWVRQDWVPWESISPSVPLAVVAAEDQRFPAHGGFDLVELETAWRDYREGGRLRGASTLSQQVAKNLFLWRNKGLLRKGMEAWFTLLIELTWPKQRILEVYLNVAQFGPHTYGVGAASWRYFDRPAAALKDREAALLAAVLPNPIRCRLEAPSAYVKNRAARIRGQMRRLGKGYLDQLRSN
jgi:monofunctional biosynthetic peptidoglycan transglycosylase